MQPGSSKTDEGLWSEITARDVAHRPALFLDRDGVLVEDTHYLGRAEDVRLLEGASAAVARCNRAGIPVVLVTNQSGIARRLYDWQVFHAVQAACRARWRRPEHISTPRSPAPIMPTAARLSI